MRAPRAVIIGGGFGGLSAAFELVRRGIDVTVLEADDEVGGLAGSFEVNGQRLEKFYHHWFTNDVHIADLVRELGEGHNVIYRPSRTGMYVANRIFRLSSPSDVLRFTPLSLADRVRLGLLALRARAVKNWRVLEHETAEEWLIRLGGERVHDVVWRPLLEGKFGPFASDVSAVWIWNKLKLRGGSRARSGREVLAYYRGGFAALAERLACAVRMAGGDIQVSTAATALVIDDGRVVAVETANGTVDADAVIATPALPIVADLVAPHAPDEWVRRLRAIEYLANICIVLELDRSLSDTYWLNVNDPGFPFVAVIEHTNFEPAATYGGRRIVYLSKYLPTSAELYRMTDADAVEYSVRHLVRMFPAFDRSWIMASHVWRARYAQPIVVRHYSQLVPPAETPVEGLYLSSMAQVYPEDRGTNYAVRDGRRIGRLVASHLTVNTNGAGRRSDYGVGPHATR
ncbi:MAG TPA: NAD(P)/FAD-dependent oxidoreductase [Gemmatimonadaceae bacterium]|jgi:protoporphyrinogen oxidase|nr:NAD(P)/FAD-dependent oxidoreductase [Gemmatimonadaceae bacterium]